MRRPNCCMWVIVTALASNVPAAPAHAVEKVWSTATNDFWTGGQSTSGGLTDDPPGPADSGGRSTSMAATKYSSTNSPAPPFGAK